MPLLPKIQVRLNFITVKSPPDKYTSFCTQFEEEIVFRSSSPPKRSQTTHIILSHDTYFFFSSSLPPFFFWVFHEFMHLSLRLEVSWGQSLFNAGFYPLQQTQGTEKELNKCLSHKEIEENRVYVIQRLICRWLRSQGLNREHGKKWPPSFMK